VTDHPIEDPQAEVMGSPEPDEEDTDTMGGEEPNQVNTDVMRDKSRTSDTP
jgi:hypothetical protein